MNKMKVLQTAVLLSASMGVAAGNFVFPIKSHHSTGDYNNDNYGIGYEGEISDNYWVGGMVYKNSINNISHMGYVYKKYPKGIVDFTLNLGIADNYENGTLVFPMLGVDLNLTNTFAVRLVTTEFLREFSDEDMVTNLSLVFKY